MYCITSLLALEIDKWQGMMSTWRCYDVCAVAVFLFELLGIWDLFRGRGRDFICSFAVCSDIDVLIPCVRWSIAGRPTDAISQIRNS